MVARLATLATVQPSAVIDAVESWLAAQSFWVQVPIVLAVLGPLCWLVAGVIDRVVERVLRRHTVRGAGADAGVRDPRGAAPGRR